ncbi:putative NADH dehydrogenase transport associated [Patulibacter medicamentivorans]|uniref:Putative NADH dehydrogenase transport associated n=1 Tax=Patulibacter medicamentivorans TaxID=1097667 RepID=H0E6X5_9ACTN|nr:FAD-dependent oxidoreductase [Patulibacter medicamentivorans]EHN10578.1 putative NADH dehydrogenase transport associated [Patulibacter medicamentivorans]
MSAPGRRPEASDRDEPPARTDVLIAGGGTAALEALLAVHAHTAGARHVTLLAPDARYRYRPLAAYAGLVEDLGQIVPLDRLAAEHGAGLICDRVARVDAERRELETVSGGRIAYETLILATGAVPHAAVDGALTLGDPRDEHAFAALVDDVRGGRVSRLAIVVPAGAGWSLPAYECALLLAHAAPEGRMRTVVVTAESRPLAAFGDTVGDAISSLLQRRGIELRTESVPDAFADGQLWMPTEGAFAVDAVVAVAQPRGPAIPGLPHDRRGFLPVETTGRVVGEDRVWAVGDVADHAVKQGGLAVQQADMAAAEVARVLGEEASWPPSVPVLRAALLDGVGTLYLRAERDGERWRTTTSREPLWWPPAKIAGGRLASWLAAGAVAP